MKKISYSRECLAGCRLARAFWIFGEQRRKLGYVRVRSSGVGVEGLQGRSQVVANLSVFEHVEKWLNLSNYQKLRFSTLYYVSTVVE